jgi:hypothetical protein
MLEVLGSEMTFIALYSLDGTKAAMPVHWRPGRY